MNPFGLARWFIDRLWYWIGWSTLFTIIMTILTTILGGTRLAVAASSFASFWGTTSLMDYLRERARIWRHI